MQSWKPEALAQRRKAAKKHAKNSVTFFWISEADRILSPVVSSLTASREWLADGTTACDCYTARVAPRTAHGVCLLHGDPGRRTAHSV